jgi:WD40 repeat protein
MKKNSLLFIFILLTITLANCSPDSQQTFQRAVDQVSTIVSTVAIKPSPTNTLIPTRLKPETPSPTKTPTIKYPVSMETSIPYPKTPITNQNFSEVKLLAQLGNGTVLGMELSPDLKSLYVLTTTGIFKYDANTLEYKQKTIFQYPMIYTHFAISPDGNKIAVVGNETSSIIHRLLVFDTELFQLSLSIKIFENIKYGISGVGFSKGSEEIICWTFDDDVAVINSITGEIKDGKKVKYKDISLDGSKASVSGQGLLNLAEKKGISLREYGIYSDGFFSTDGRLIYTYSKPYFKIWDIDQNKVVGRLKLPKYSWYYFAAISPDQRYFAATQSTTTYVWDVASGKLLYTFDTPDNSYHLTFSGDSQKLLVSVPAPAWIKSPSIVKNDDRETGIFVWNLSDGTLDQIIPGYENWIREVAFSPDGKILAAGGEGSNVYLWNIPEFTVKGIINTGLGVNDLVFSPDNQYLLTVDNHKSIVRLWSTSDWRMVSEYDVTSGGSWPMVAFSSDSKMFGVGISSRVRIYAVNSLKPILTLDGTPVDTYGHTGFAFTDSNSIISIVNGDDVWIYGLDKGKLIGKKQNTMSGDYNLGFSDLNFARNAAGSGLIISMKERFNGGLLGIATSPDHSFIAGGNEFGAIWVWGIEP